VKIAKTDVNKHKTTKIQLALQNNDRRIQRSIVKAINTTAR